MKKVLGIATLLSVLSLVTMIYLTYSAQAEAPAIYIQTSLFLLFSSVALVGLYSVQSFKPETNKMALMAIRVLAVVLIAGGGLVSYNVVDFVSAINWLISGGIIFLLLVQVQLVGGGSQGGLAPKITSLLIILSNLFLAIFFITTLEYAELKIWIHIAILASVVSFILGMLLAPKANPSVK